MERAISLERRGQTPAMGVGSAGRRLHSSPGQAPGRQKTNLVAGGQPHKGLKSKNSL